MRHDRSNTIGQTRRGLTWSTCSVRHRTVSTVVTFCASLLLSHSVSCGQSEGGTGQSNRDDEITPFEEEPIDTGFSLEELELTARQSGATEVLILRPTDEEQGTHWVLFDGLGIGVDRSRGSFAFHEIDFDMPDGLWHFPEGGTLFFQDGFGDAGSFVELQEGALVVSGPANIRRDVLVGFSSKNGGVTCNPGSYACCGKNAHGQWVAKCITTGHQTPGGAEYPTSCVNGGPNASACTNGHAIVISIDVREIEDIPSAFHDEP